MNFFDIKSIDLFDTKSCKDENVSFNTRIDNSVPDPNCVTEFGPIATEEEINAINKLYLYNQTLRGDDYYYNGEGIDSGFNEDEAWIQTYSGRRFNPLNPNYKAIVIQDIAHALSNICRFTGHCLNFYSVAQHCVLVSYICNKENSLMGLLHDATEAYCQDLSSPIKRTPELKSYRDLEAKIQLAVCKKFSLNEVESPDVKNADLVLLATEARDLLLNPRKDFDLKVKPLPFTIVPLPPAEAKKLFLERFAELISERKYDSRKKF